MSRAATDWAWSIDPGKAPLKLILLSMADRADEEHCCYPSIDRLVRDTSLNKKTVQAGINELAKLGLIKDTGERKGPTRRVRVFRLILNSQSTQKRNNTKNGNIKSQRNEPKNGNVTENGNIPENGTLNDPENGFLNVPENGVQNRSLEPVIEPVDDAGASSSTQAVDCVDHDHTDATVTDHGTTQAAETEDPFLSNLFSSEPSETLPAVQAPAQSRECFAMHFEWYPSQDFQLRHSRYGSALGPDGMQMVLEEFQHYWTEESRAMSEFDQDEWERKFLRQLQWAFKNMRPATSNGGTQTTPQQKRAALSSLVMEGVMNPDSDW